ncbi:hypothetical protein RND81_09G230800 [Saponaria officinalis]|uniref:Uncharacterized protein n=1 Tax=Saponaria officinalis TaxID=3572 RepID=A0AAW1IPT5_SAPOF
MSMPKFLPSPPGKKRHHRRRSTALSGDKNMYHGLDDYDKIEKTKNEPKNNPLTKFIRNPTRVGSILSCFFKCNKKSSDRERSMDDFEAAKCTSSSTFAPFLGNNKSKRVNNIWVKGKSLSRISMSKIKGSIEVKTGKKIKGVIVRMKSRENDEKKYELCKKKILMGEKCRPFSGHLRYDENGVFVPDDLI